MHTFLPVRGQWCNTPHLSIKPSGTMLSSGFYRETLLFSLLIENSERSGRTKPTEGHQHHRLDLTQRPQSYNAPQPNKDTIWQLKETITSGGARHSAWIFRKASVWIRAQLWHASSVMFWRGEMLIRKFGPKVSKHLIIMHIPLSTYVH